MNPQKMKG